MYYATDRCKTGKAAPSQYYGRCLAAQTDYGIAQVTFPDSHQPGNIERPLDLWIISFPERQERHVTLHRLGPLGKDEFFARMTGAITSTQTKSAFVFIHGFNNSFEEAAWRAAQISLDVRLDMVPILYSWPSKESATEYMADAQFAEIAMPRLRQFLEDVAARSGAQTVHLIAHSMGSRVVSRALTEMVRSGKTTPQFRHLVLGAPDISTLVFNEQIAPYLQQAGVSVSVYASETDKALKLSQQLQAQFPRLGQVVTKLDVPSFVDVINATVVNESAMGHAYLFESGALLKDLFPLLHDGKRAAARLRLGPNGYWVLAP